jgi:hypothetical protein
VFNLLLVREMRTSLYCKPEVWVNKGDMHRDIVRDTFIHACYYCYGVPTTSRLGIVGSSGLLITLLTIRQP